MGSKKMGSRKKSSFVKIVEQGLGYNGLTKIINIVEKEKTGRYFVESVIINTTLFILM
jgi:hypothetical protein